jgi:hypothetical protein
VKIVDKEPEEQQFDEPPIPGVPNAKHFFGSEQQPAQRYLQDLSNRRWLDTHRKKQRKVESTAERQN